MKHLARKTFILGLGSVLFLGACENVPEIYKQGITDLPQPEVSMASSASHQINFGDSSALGEAQKEALRNFIRQSGIRYGDELIFDFAPGDRAVWEKKAALDNYLKTIGVWVDTVAQTGNVSNPSTVHFIVNRYQATVPDCIALSREMFVPTEMEKNKIFGCLTAHNLAVHVANPRDLQTGEDFAGTTSEAAYRAIQLYRVRFGTQIAPVSTSGSRGGSSIRN